MRSPTPNHDFARKLRSQLSLPEKLLWVRLKRRDGDRPIFRRQHPIRPYVLDFYCALATLCVEIDGATHYAGDGPERDARRDAFLRARGIEVLRVPASSVLRDPDDVADWLVALARERIAAKGSKSER